MPGNIDPTSPLAVPPGGCSMISAYNLASSWTPSYGAAQYVSIALLSGVCGRGYNTYTGTGLNGYFGYFAGTGTGKDSISATCDSLINSVSEVKGAKGIRGASSLASAPAILRALEANPVMFCNIGEFGKKLQEWNNPKNPNGIGIQLLLREAFTRSGKGKFLGSSAYSDTAKNITAIPSPALTIIAEGVPEEFFACLNEEIISGGTLPRFNVFIDTEPRSYSNRSSGTATIPPDLKNWFSNLVATALANARNGTPCIVWPTPEAEQELNNFDDECTELINSGNEGVVKHLWNRAHLKALKLASISAISRNYIQPTICRDDALWAISLVRRQTKQLISKFERNEVGAIDGDESKQLDELIKAIGRYCSTTFDDLSGYGGFDEAMHKDGVFTETYLSRILTKRAAFRNDKRGGATVALKRALKNLVEGDEIREMSKAQMLAKYGTGSRSFIMSNPERFLKACSMALDAR